MNTSRLCLAFEPLARTLNDDCPSRERLVTYLRPFSNSIIMPDTPPTLYLLDSHALIFQMFHAIPQMSAPDGRPTNAVFGVTRDLISICDDVKPTYLLATFDTPEPTFRNEIYPAYKAQRPPAPPDLLLQIPTVYSVLEAMNLPILAIPGWEADDIMATVAASAAARGIDVTLCTSDKDCRQIIGERVRMLNLRKKTVMDPPALLVDWGVRPDQVVDFQALVGDTADNVKGVQGVGEKTAARLLQQYDTLENLIAHVDEIQQAKLKENIKKAIANGDLALSRKLVRLETNVPMNLDWENWHRKPWDGPKLVAIFEELGFRSYAQRVRGTLKSVGQAKNTELLKSIRVSAPATASGMTQGDLFAESSDEGTDEFSVGSNVQKPVDSWKTDYKLVDDPESWSEFLEQLCKQKRFAIDLETTGLDPLQAKIVGYAFCWEDTKGWYVAVRGPASDKKLNPEAVVSELKPILEDPSIAKVNQNIKYDQIVLRAAGIELKGVAGDSMIAHYLLHSGERTHNLDELTRKYFGHENISITQLIGKGKNQKSMADVPTALVSIYAAEDADAAWRLANKLEAELDPGGLRTIYDTLEIPLIEVLADLEATGIRLDVAFLKRVSKDMAGRLEILETEIHRLAGKEFNIASLKQLREILFKDLNLPILKRTNLSDEPSTDQETLEKLAAMGHAVPKSLIEHRQISKLKGTYVDALPELVNPDTGRLHTSFNQTVAATGRLSSSDPNLQNVPARTDMGREIRQAFLPREGWVLITADYSQIELRLMAHFAGDEALATAFAEGRDIHSLVAAQIFSVDEQAVTSDMRRVAKTVNFGIIYGMSAFGLAERLTIERSKADTFINQYFARYPKVLSYQDNLLKKAKQDGFVASILGRRRKFDPSAIRSNTNYHGRNQAEREAINMEIQASAADLIKLAMLNVHRRLRDEKREAKMLLSVHDELVFEAPPREVDAIAKLVREEMIGAMKLNVPLEVEVCSGKNWLEVEEIK
ncbi:MAG: DNA polymerase I [Gemmataceae bacterium]|nr:DNA polymerase I [Gemmataceae bacterium]